MVRRVTANNPASSRIFYEVDHQCLFGYNTGMKLEINEVLQWTGAVFIIAGHSLNAMGPAVYPYNIIAFFLGTILFMSWSVRVANKPQLLVNIVALLIGLTGLAKAFG